MIVYPDTKVWRGLLLIVYAHTYDVSGAFSRVWLAGGLSLRLGTCTHDNLLK